MSSTVVDILAKAVTQATLALLQECIEQLTGMFEVPGAKEQTDNLKRTQMTDAGQSSVILPTLPAIITETPIDSSRAQAPGRAAKRVFQSGELERPTKRVHYSAVETVIVEEVQAGYAAFQASPVAEVHMQQWWLENGDWAPAELLAPADLFLGGVRRADTVPAAWLQQGGVLEAAIEDTMAPSTP